MKTTQRQNFHFPVILLLALPLLGISCASPYLKGTAPDGEKVYVGSTAIKSTEGYDVFLRSAQTEADKLTYLFKRFTEAKDLHYYYEGARYSWLEAYRGAMWALRHQYKKGQEARSFIQKQVLDAAKPGQPNLIELPDESFHLAYYILLNELDLLEETFAHDPNAQIYSAPSL